MTTFGKRTRIPGVTTAQSAVPRPWLAWVLAVLLVCMLGAGALVVLPRLT